MQGIIYIKVALYLETDVTEEQAQEIVNEMDYEISHPLINHTEIQAEAAGAFTPEVLEQMSDDMDLPIKDICLIIDDAQAEFDEIKSKL